MHEGRTTYFFAYQGCTRCGTLNRDARHPACTQVPVQPVALAPRCRCRMVQSRALHLRCKVQLGASAPHLGACTIRSPVARTYIVQPATGNARCSLKYGVYSVSGWAGAHPGNLCMRSARASGSHAILRSATKPAARPISKNHTSQELELAASHARF